MFHSCVKPRCSAAAQRILWGVCLQTQQWAYICTALFCICYNETSHPVLTRKAGTMSHMPTFGSLIACWLSLYCRQIHRCKVSKCQHMFEPAQKNGTAALSGLSGCTSCVTAVSKNIVKTQGTANLNPMVYSLLAGKQRQFSQDDAPDAKNPV